MGGIAAAAAAPAGELARPAATTPTAPPNGPAAVRELVGERSENSKHFLLSDGTRRAEIHSSPIHAKTADGEWVDLDTSLVPVKPGVFRSKAASVALSVTSGLLGVAPVQIETAEHVISIDYLSGLERAPFVIGDTALYGAVAPATDLLYESTGEGVKETLVLASASAPSTHTFRLNTPGLRVAPARSGGWAFFEPGSEEPAAWLGALTVWDSSSDARGEPAYCAAAKMTVTPTKDGAEVTYEVDPKWLADPARAFPVYVDPTVSFYPAYDTYLWSYTPGVAYGASEEMKAGYDPNGHCRTLVRFDTSSIPQHSTVNSSTVSLYSPSGSAAAFLNCARVTSTWGEWSTWNYFRPSFDTATAVRKYLSGTNIYHFFNITDFAQGWVDGTYANYGVQVSSDPETTTNPWRKFYARERAGTNQDPVLRVDYQTAPAAPTSVSATGTGLEWLTQADRDRDGIPDTPGDLALQGRGRASLSWNAASGATGYSIYAHDSNSWQKVGQVLGRNTTTWTSEAGGIFPTDTQIRGWPANYAGNAYTYAATPRPNTQEAMFSAPATSGIVLNDGTYLYVRAWGTSDATAWRKVGSGLRGTTAGSDEGAVGAATSNYRIRSGLLLDGFLYSGWVTAASASHNEIQGVWTNVSQDATQTRTLRFSKPLLDMRTGADVTSVGTNAVLLTSDGEHIYSISDLTSVGYGGWKVREYTREGVFKRDATVPGPSFTTDGAMCDGQALYLVQYSGAAQIYKLRLSDFSLANIWGSGQGTSGCMNGSYDPHNKRFWLGGYQTRAVMRYTGSGLDLRDDPNELYVKMNGSSWDTSRTYQFKVVSTNPSGTAEASPIVRGLPPRTVGVNDDPRHTTADLGEALGAQLSVELESGNLAASVTDLEIASWGPRACVSRTYDSERTTTGAFAPGWHFNFEANLATQGAYSVFTDEEGERHSFIATQGVYFPPKGYYATLTSDTTGFALTTKERTAYRFGPTGRLESVTDPNGNQITYSWDGGDLSIKAANGQTIFCDFDGSRLATATYSTADGTRQVVYGTSPGWRVTYYPGTGDEYAVTHAHDASSRLASIAAPGLTGTEWGFGYTSGKLTQVRYPGYSGNASCRTDIGYGTGSAITTSFGEVAGIPDTAIRTEYQINPSGTTLSRTEPTLTAGSNAKWRWEYAPGNEAVVETSPAGHVLRRSIDATGNTTCEYDEEGNATNWAYDAFSQPVRITDPRGCTTYRQYDAAGNLLAEEKQLTAYERSRTAYSYNASGTVVSESRRLSATTSATTTYGDFAACGEPQTTTQLGVELGFGGPVNLVTTRVYDAFGNLMADRDACGTTTTINAYSNTTRLRLASQTDAAGAVTRHAYDMLGRQTDTSRTAAGGAFGDWVRKSYDLAGNVATETYLAGPGAVDRTVTHTYDAMGREYRTDDSQVTGVARSWLDAHGNAIRSWAEGANLSQVSASTRITYDAYGQETSRIEPGSVASSTVTTYFATGRVKRVDGADGTWSRYAYDAAGNQIAEGVAGEGSQAATTTSEYDVAGRLIRTQTPETGGATAYAYDLADRQIAAAAEGATPTVSAYNSAGWLLAITEPDGVLTARTYDAAGRMLTETKAGKTTTSTYDGAGRLVRTDNPDGSFALYAYDVFGRTVAETQTAASGGLVKDETTAYDTLSRPSRTYDARRDIERTFTYPASPGEGTAVAMRVGSVTSTVAVGADGLETARTATGRGLSSARAITATDAAGRARAWTWQGTAGGHTFDDAGRVMALIGLGWQSGGATYSYASATGRQSAGTLRYRFGSRTHTAAFTYTDAGRLRTETSGSVVTTYTHNGQGQLTYVQTAGVTHRNWYNATGQLYQTTSTGLPTRHFAYDAATGARTTEGLSPSAPSRTYTWDASAHLRGLTDASRSVAATYTYDASGQRTRSVVASGSVTTTTTYTYEGLTLHSLSAERSDTATWSLEYLYDGEGRPYAAIYAASDAAPVLTGIVTTLRGDVAGLTDASGAVFALYRYEAFGAHAEAASAATGSIPATLAAAITARNPLRYAGYCFDEHSGLYYCSARYYDPASRQFISKDPARADGEASAYQYCGGDPVGKVDPSGEKSRTLSIRRYPSNGSACWAACLKVVIDYIHGCNISETYIYRTYFPAPRFPLGRGQNQYSVENMLKHWNLRAELSHGAARFSTIERSIDRNQPLIAFFLTPPGHGVVICGYERTAASRRIMIMDPFRGTKKWYTRDWLRNADRSHPFPEGSPYRMKWDDTLKYIRKRW